MSKSVRYGNERGKAVVLNNPCLIGKPGQPRMVLEVYIGRKLNGISSSQREYCLHKCNDPLCIELTHLYVGSPRDNLDDIIASGARKGLGVISAEVTRRAMQAAMTVTPRRGWRTRPDHVGTKDAAERFDVKPAHVTFARRVINHCSPEEVADALAGKKTLTELGVVGPSYHSMARKGDKRRRAA